MVFLELHRNRAHYWRIGWPEIVEAEVKQSTYQVRQETPTEKRHHQDPQVPMWMMRQSNNLDGLRYQAAEDDRFGCVG
jgi:hypothetical protein